MDAKQKYIQAQYKYANFSDANEDIMLASLRQISDRLENEMQLAYNVYSQSAQQMQIALAKVHNNPAGNRTNKAQCAKTHGNLAFMYDSFYIRRNNISHRERLF